ncbi:MAG: 50S ribosomal protein L17 [candidate division WS2 bacterium ADurb.Bin280]|uniref:50S ribosomal protein L17 n=1 Tax=candidate division WS2 bacterium ADurb.Bin280 TaxID=1852829 RepID=A0A1V5SCN5_9BACT|nr:MAG: 50S ribosomal protein L17 [candidate division WS2 bacterium ADurb.Bin280]
MRKVKLSLKNQARDRAGRNLLSSLIVYGEIETTLPKAKFLKSKAEAFFAKLASIDNLSRIRLSKSVLYSPADEKVHEIAFESIRIFKLSHRFGDNAPMARVVLKLKDDTAKDKKAENSKEKKTGGAK